MPNDDAKRTVLARRARFIAAALAGLSVGCGKEKAVMLDAGPRNVDAGVDAAVVPKARPHACLCVCEPGDPLCSCL